MLKQYVVSSSFVGGPFAYLEQTLVLFFSRLVFHRHFVIGRGSDEALHEPHWQCPKTRKAKAKPKKIGEGAEEGARDGRQERE